MSCSSDDATSTSNIIVPRGIHNVSGVSCHLTSALQLIFHILVPLRQALIEVAKTSNLLSLPPICVELGRFFQSLQSNELGDPSDLYRHLEQCTSLNPHTLGDAVTGVRVLLQTIRQSVADMDTCTSETSWKTTFRKLIDFSIEGSIKQKIVGSNGCLERRKAPKIRSLPCPFPVPLASSLDKGLNAATCQEINGYNWDSATDFEEVQIDGEEPQQEWTTKKQVQFESLPQHLLLHLQRFSYQDGRVVLLTNPMEIPCTELHLHTYCANSLSSSMIQYQYQLQGCLLHVADSPRAKADKDEEEGGHYVALIKHASSWFILDDENVTDLTDILGERDLLEFLSGRPSAVTEELQAGGSEYCPTLLAYTDTNRTQHATELLNVFQKQLDEAEEQARVDWDEPLALVGRRLKVKWAKGKFYPGIVASFNQETGKHSVKYDDGDVRDYKLQNKTIEWLS